MGLMRRQIKQAQGRVSSKGAGSNEALEAPRGGKERANVDRMLKAIERSDLKEAEGICNLLRNDAGLLGETWAACGKVMQRLGHHSEAIECLQSALAVGGGSGALHKAAGLSCLETGEYAGAISHLNAALDLGVESGDVLWMIGKAFVLWGRPIEADPLLRRAIRKNSEDAEAYFWLGKAVHSRGLLDEALSHYKAAMERMPGNIDTYLEQADVLVDLGRFEDALVRYQEAIEMRPRDATLWTRSGMCLRARGLLREAQHDCRNAITFNPGSPEALVNLGKVEADIGDGKMAAALFEKALVARPGLHSAHRLTHLRAITAGGGGFEGYFGVRSSIKCRV